MAVSLTDVVTYKRLVAVGNNELWYEGTGVGAGTLTELTAANGDIDTSDQLTMFEAFQKVFVVNGAKLFVADFINTRLTSEAQITTNIPVKGDILTQDNTDAKIIVDYIYYDDTASDHYVYGYNLSGTFNTTDLVKDSDDNTIISGANLSAVDSAPQWYPWQVYNEGPASTYGNMPDKAYLGCLYNGRCVLAGNPDYPNQWYMSRVDNPWNWLYGENDPLSAVSGGAGDVGEIGDIIRCLIPYKDDYLIFGCANSMKVIRGDPACGGSRDEIDLTVGIYGAKSWCHDGGGNLYFWGSGGIYKLPRDFGQIENLSALRLPELISDEAADPSTHRITMEYDRKRNGLFITVTKVTDGTNSCYWYDLALKSFYPESYPEQCGAYSLFYYDANDTDYKDLLVGCKDGYIRKFDDSKKDDDIGDTNEAINSYVALPVTIIGNTEEDREGRLTSLVFELGGGTSGGLHGDTNGLSYAVYIGDDAESVIEKMKAETAWADATEYAIGDLVVYDSVEYVCIVAHTSEAGGDTHEEPDTNTTDWSPVAFATGTLSGTGRKTKIRVRARAMYIGIKIYNSTESETWVLNRLLGDIKPAGKLR